MKLILTIFLLTISAGTSSWNKNHQIISGRKSYDEIKIGNQIWMAQNLNVSTFRNGDVIMQAQTKAEWRTANAKKQPAWCYYNNDSVNGALYGKLYNWSAVNDKRGLAPEGWHIPSGNEWHILHAFSGGIEAMDAGGHGDKVGRNLKSTTGWEKEGNGDNIFDFNALPAGVRTIDLLTPNNGYRWMGSLTIWWSTHEPEMYSDVECFVIRGTDEAVFEWHETGGGYSVRCVKDQNPN